MSKLKVLLLEDDKNDAELIERDLKEFCDLVVAYNRDEFSVKVGQQAYDLVLADYSLGQYTGLDALKFIRMLGLDIPFVMVSGTVTEDFMADCLRQGVSDYVVKRGTRMLRLVEAVRDSVERYRMRKALEKSEHMANLGELSTGMGHDLNNILGSIKGAHFLLSSMLSNEGRKILDIATSAANRGEEILNQLMTLARGSNGGKYCIVDPGQILGQLLPLLKTGFPKNINLVSRVFPGTEPFVCDPSAVQNMLQNLAVNARDSMPGGGSLTIEAQNWFVENKISNATREIFTGNFVVFCVRDTGTGIPESILPKVFDSFFTTKPFGKGTGLGLANVLRDMKKHKGYVDVISTEGVGSQFFLFFPMGTSGVAPNTNMTEKMVTGNQELVLLVDDEKSLHHMTKTALETYGYRVLSAFNGLEGVTMFKQNQTSVDCIISDLQMPFMDGREMAEKVHELRQDCPVVFMTGAVDEAMQGHVLKKPFSIPDLLRVVKQAVTHERTTQ